MARVSLNSALAERMYAPGITLEAELYYPLSSLMSDSDTAIITTEDLPGSKRGNVVQSYFQTFDRTGRPKVDGEDMVGHERDTVETSQDLTLKYFKEGVAIENLAVDQTTVSYAVREPKLHHLGRFWAEWAEKGMFYHLAGHATTAINAETDYGLSLGNIVVAQDTEHTYWAEGASVYTTDAGVAGDATAILTTEAIDDLLAKVTDPNALTYPMVPGTTPFGELFVLMVGSQGFKQIRSSAAGNEFRDLQHSAIQGGMEAEASALMDNGGYIYGNTLVLQNPFAPKGLTSGSEQANTRVGLFLGANAGARKWGERFAEGNHLGYSEFRVHERLSMQTNTVTGFVRTVYNSKSIGAIRVVHYSSL